MSWLEGSFPRTKPEKAIRVPSGDHAGDSASNVAGESSLGLSGLATMRTQISLVSGIVE
jgi:hypothetical protein